jgi:hypothetical protein
MAKFRAAPLYIKNKKVAEITEVTMTLTRGGEQQIGFEEVLGASVGVKTVEFSFKTVVPVVGMQIDLEGLLLGDEEFSIGFLAGGRTYKAPCLLDTATTSSTSKTGTTTGDYKAMNSGPIQRI